MFIPPSGGKVTPMANVGPVLVQDPGALLLVQQAAALLRGNRPRQYSSRFPLFFTPHHSLMLHHAGLEPHSSAEERFVARLRLKCIPKLFLRYFVNDTR